MRVLAFQTQHSLLVRFQLVVVSLFDYNELLLVETTNAFQAGCGVFSEIQY